MSLTGLYLLFFCICVLLSAFFSSSETAFTAIQRIRLENLISKGIPGAKRVAKMIERPEKFLSTILLCNNFVNTAAAALATVLAITFWGDEGVLIATIIVTIILLIFAETTPKTIAAQHAERLALWYSPIMHAIAWVLTPLVWVLSWIAAWFSRLIGGGAVPRSLVSADEIRTMISLGHKEGTVEEDEANLLHKVFDFGDRTVREVMVPRPEVIAMQQGAMVSDFLALYAESPLSRFPVYQDNMDNIVGILAVKDVLMALAKNTVSGNSTIDSLLRPAYFTPESKPINELFAEMRDDNYRMAVVVDEYGDTVGIVSLSRLVEEIVGEVGDEMAGVEKEYEVIDEHTFQVDGSMRIEDANLEMGLSLPEGDAYETVAGLILSLLGHIPRPNEKLRYRGLKFTVTEMKGLKIEKILLTRERPTTVQRVHPQTKEEEKKESPESRAS